jgi:dihydrofolate synthase/folylpolyglutamate synthase
VNYAEAVRFLYSLGNEVQTAKLGLERISALLSALGRPECSFRIVHVAGTNGKGSTCAMIEAGLRASGIRTGLFTSPHLIEPTERIQVSGFPVTDGQFAKACSVVHETARRLPLDCHPTYFETVTAMGFWLFRELGVETAVVEVGLGGRLDATNVVQPALCVITPVDLDHQTYLGDTIRQIAGEKAGILKPGVRCVFSRQPSEAAEVLASRAAELGSKVTWTSDCGLADIQISERGSSFRVFNPALHVDCPLAGEHQIENALTAALALRELGSSPRGISEARWPGRLEHVAPNPDIILDGAHNPAGARALAKYVGRFYGHKRLWLIFGAMIDKAVPEIGQIIFPCASELVFTAPSNARALSPRALMEIAGRGEALPNAAAALDHVRSRASAGDVIVVTGSLYLVGEARALLSRHSRHWA